MSRKFRPAQCPGCKFVRFSREVCVGGRPFGIRSYEDVGFVGESDRKCPDYSPRQEPKTEEVSK